MATQREMTDLVDRPVIDAEELIMALQNHDLEFEYFVDRSTGEILLLGDEAVVGEDGEGLRSLIDDNPDRFLAIDSIPSSSGWQTMADFIETLPPGEFRERLSRAVQHTKPFRRFKDELLHYPDVRQVWFEFEYREMLAIARDWLKDEGVEADLKIREPASRRDSEL